MNEKTLSTRSVFEGRLLNIEVLDVELDSGVRTTREIVRHMGAVAVLARCPDGRFVLVRQFRKPVECEALEIVAGVLENGESPEGCAAREVREETGFDVTRLTKLGSVWPSPGYTSEELHLFFAELSDAPGESKFDEDEVLEIAYLTKDQIVEMISEGEIRDAKMLSAWCLWTARKDMN
jgi:ADP-ribose pyrophosphatase